MIAPCSMLCRYLLYLSTLSSGASAAHDLRPAVAALTRPPQPPAEDFAPRPYDPRPAALLSVYYCQGAPETLKSDAAPETEAVPHAVRAAEDRSSSSGCAPTARLPLSGNVAVCGAPDGHIGCAAALAGAERLFRRLIPEQTGLMAALGNTVGLGDPHPDLAGDDSDDEAVGALASALKGLGEGENGI